ncbi:MAG: (E)-4-hydroxy-3-methylbut-2-enyl-diphosphate synthase [Bacteroidales bacterium]
MNDAFPLISTYQRLETLEVPIGQLPVGSRHPIRLQSMTNTPTLDTRATVEQCMRLFDAGCDYVRITAQGPKEAAHLAIIKEELHRKGYTRPLIADIHFSPEAAEIAAGIVEKVRINPGNYTDRKKGKIHYTDSEYREELERIRDRMAPLINICRQHDTALRIGSNHGSLSERIMSRYGDTPEGMVQAALEFIEICESLDFKQLVISMKASNPFIMITANRLLVKRMQERGRVYPIHLGVTEAGDAEDGRIKSAAGIGALLAEGIGDTIRVSLTEAPEAEIPVARILASLPQKFGGHSIENLFTGSLPINRNPRQQSREIHGMGGSLMPQVIGTVPPADIIIQNQLPFAHSIIHTSAFHAATLKNLAGDRPLVVVSDHPMELMALRNTLAHLAAVNFSGPIILKRESNVSDAERFITESAAALAPIFQEGFGNALWLHNPALPAEVTVNAAFGILQSSRARISRAEYIACPSCGRTLFNIQDTLRKIKEKTSHLKGITIGVMGCIVNGPGEMAGANYGYVGAGRGRVTLYKGQTPVKREVPEEEAVDELIRLIKENGQWIEP